MRLRTLHSLYSLITHLREAAPGPLDGDLALVVDGGPDVDGLAGHVASPVQPDPAGDRARSETGHAQLVLDLAVERLLKISTSNKYSNAFEQSQNVEANLNSICCLSAQFERAKRDKKRSKNIFSLSFGILDKNFQDLRVVGQ